MNPGKKSIIVTGLLIFIGLISLIYFLMPFFILQLMKLDFISPELDFFYEYAPSNVMSKVTHKSLSKEQTYKVRCNTLHTISKHYSGEKLQSLESLITDCLKSQNEKERHAAAVLYSKRKFIPSQETLKLLWQIFLNTNEDRYIRNLTGLALLKKCYQNSDESKLIVETYKELDPKIEFGLVFEYYEKRNDNGSFIKLNGLIYKGD